MSDMGLGTKVFGSAGGSAVDLNQAQNTILIRFVAHKPIRLVRYGVMCVTGNIELAGRLKLRRTTLADPTTFADISGSTGGLTADRPVGFGYYKNVGAQVSAASDSVFDIEAGVEVALAVEVDNGATGTAHAFIEYVERPFVGTPIIGTDADAPDYIASQV